MGLFAHSVELNPGGNKRFWIHAASVGEVLASYPFVQLLMKTYPDSRIIYSVVTETGMGRLKELFGNRVKGFRFPFDSYRHFSRIHRNFKPDALFVVETEIWPNLLLSASERGVPIFLLNARISRSTVSRLRVAKRLARLLLNSFTVIFARNGLDARLFIEAGASPSKIIVVGSLKYDTISRPLKGIRREELGLRTDDFVVVFGSIRSKEFGEVMKAVKIVVESTDAKLILAPRHLKNVKTLSGMIADAGLDFGLRSDRKRPGARIIILDTIGELWDIYHLSDLAFVGGSLADYGGHNVLEPAYAGVPVIFGPYVWNIQDYAYPMLENGIAFRVFDGEELGRLIADFAADPAKARTIGEKARQFVKARSGVSKKILRYVREHIG